MKVNIKYHSDCKHDFGLFPDKLADAYIDVSDEIWGQFVAAKAEYKFWYTIINIYKQKKMKAKSDSRIRTGDLY